MLGAGRAAALGRAFSSLVIRAMARIHLRDISKDSNSYSNYKSDDSLY